ncbi:MAG: HK97 family phage prohead protease [Caloramator sp.]|nr:HK97 family phage prohead protease [Caloramator sp.]
MERRTIYLEELRVNSLKQEEDKVRIIEGHAAVFDKWSEELGFLVPFKEKVLKGAFKESIEKDDIRALFNHDANYVLGRNKSGTLFLQEDETGLKVRIIPPDTQWARDLLVSIERGDISQMSFGFTVLEDRWGYQDGIDVRELVKVKLFDVSPVTFPAYTETDVGVRGLVEEYNKRKQTRLDEERRKNIKRLELLKKKYELLGK